MKVREQKLLLLINGNNMIKKAILILFLICMTASADTWNKTDKILLTTYLIGETIDILQTREILHNNRFRELNPLIKKNTDMYICGAVTTGIIILICHKFPKYRRNFLIGVNAFKWGYVGYNLSIGVRF